ncbi:MAG: hypothetical protein GPJ54_10350 [Candidatus Heimdallarchaeota archaeon]|nr:hypothetical protein [Candidatus Heimdallarchaeota archaeon]
MLPLGLLNLSIAWFGAQLIIDFIKYPGGDVFGIPNFIFFVIGLFIIGIATPGLQALYKFHKVEKHNSMNDARRVIIIEYTIIGVLSIATVVIPIIAVAMIFYIKSSRWDIYVEFMRFSKIKTKSVNKLDPDDTHIIQTGIV